MLFKYNAIKVGGRGGESQKLIFAQRGGRGGVWGGAKSAHPILEKPLSAGQNKDHLKIRNDPKKEDNHKNEDYPKKEDHPKIEDDQQIKMTPNMKTASKN